jgi:hypothetical protein
MVMAPTNPRAAGCFIWVFAGAILVGAFLLFQVQPLICKLILPRFGGGPSVWTTCMLFFQSLLFCGYAYAHLAACMPARRQSVVHLALIAGALACLPIAPDPGWRPNIESNPTWQILGLLTICVGLPYGLLASTGPLVQSWFSRLYPGRSPYRLYALSNIGALLALVSYPVLFEPRFDLGTQVTLWSAIFWLYAALCGACAVRVWRLAQAHVSVPDAVEPAARAEVATKPAPAWSSRALWVALPACASLALLAATNHVCQVVAPMPFLWMAPLALYLLTFIICFDHERWYHRGAFATLVVLSIAAVTAFQHFGTDVIPVPFGMAGRLALYFATLFFMAMVCHGELVRLRPSPSHLTEFYLAIAAGGAIGGIFVSLIAPTIFVTYVEWPIALGACYAIASAVLIGSARGFVVRCIAGTLAAIGLVLIILGQGDWEVPVDVARNFYGVVSVWEANREDPAHHRFTMRVDGVAHGRQFADTSKRALPVSYYSPESGIGRSFAYLRRRGGLRVGVVGLGVGTLTAYARPGDVLRFYEINPEARRMAETYFTYLRDCQAPHAIVMGDARLSLEREEPQQFDLLVMDAFTGHAVPVHLLTREAGQIYLRHLKPDGVLAFNITSQFLDFQPVLQKLGENFGLKSVIVRNDGDPDRLAMGSRWMLLSRDEALYQTIPAAQVVSPSPGHEISLWTDSYNDLFSILKK